MGDLVIHAVGDVGPKRAEPGSIFARTPDLADCDVLFGQMEVVLTDHASAAPNAKLALRSSPSTARALKQAGFAAMSVAGNHAMDFGAQGLLETVKHLREAGVAPCGGGAMLAEARQPAIVEANGRRVAFLAYSSILPAGFAAEANKPGCAPMWAHTHYEQIEPDQPGTGARVRSFADKVHLAALIEDVRAAKREADVVAVSLHWGVHFVRAVLADYQREVAHAAIDAGAGMIIGHHPHILKAVEIYRGRPVFYSLGNFAIEQPSAFKEDVHLDAAFKDISKLGGAWRPGEKYMIPPDTRLTLVARCVVDGKGDISLRLRPHWIDDNSDPWALEGDDPRFGEVLAYLSEVTAEADVATRFARAGSEIVIDG
jgi:poly-gamma-glutamate synthesis protein (capsule biosynthesis protein)